ncbi:hypothetical protein SAMN05444166_3345 [Singulisphaera sp. GP187]|uniref:hypothetical protein n=1 Tax=Singulisphaera sp. GP187 TaxID=1882752 RepID=UPI00092598C7|nr:hypothetical protein [Singulisphaera sp. GP187]SIO26667.1 hypothetical protein SAMN05444166_3345 [Singulisphaera sp. GP187]
MASWALSSSSANSPSPSPTDAGAAEYEFMQAIQAYRNQSGRMFPTWSEILEVAQSLGYTKAKDAIRGQATPRS